MNDKKAITSLLLLVTLKKVLAFSYPLYLLTVNIYFPLDPERKLNLNKTYWAYCRGQKIV